ncbi:unnamed protein product [Schistocephalus solidus]|uniref:Reverse transcriptase domain-containing protein n=1 Tax=Schistocephalus solidus TaxID=70667 RepID=A0A183SZG5_SCHSO|nr:unnamed protein product [Schistocephalus solidus]
MGTGGNELANRLANLPVVDADTSVENRWCQLRDTIQSTALDVLGRACRQHQDCFDDNDAASTLCSSRRTIYTKPTSIALSLQTRQPSTEVAALYKVLQNFEDATIVHLYKKKENRQLCDNHRGILLRNITGKTFASILLNQLNAHLEQRLLPESHCGFLRKRGTIDMIFTARQLQEKCQEMRTHRYITFVDLTKSFDKVNCGRLPLSEPVTCLMWKSAHWLTDRRTRLRVPQHDLAPIMECAHWLTDRRTRLRAPQHDLAPITHQDSQTQGIWSSHRRLTPSSLDTRIHKLRGYGAAIAV